MGIFRSQVRSTASKRAHTVKPMLEALEERVVLSTASVFIHAVNDASNNSAVFYINHQDGAFYEHNASYGTRELSGPKTVQTFSAGVDTKGNADVFVKATDNSFWEYNSSGWHEILGPGYVNSFAAVKGDRVYFQNYDNSLWEYNSSAGFHQLAGPNSVLSIDAVTDNSGRDAVFALLGDHTFGEFYNGSYSQLSRANIIQAGFSAGLDKNGNADVYSLASDNTFREYNSYLGWRILGDAGTVRSFSATSNETVDAIASDGTLIKFDQTGTRTVLDNGVFTEVSAARDDDVYTAFSDNSGWERTGGGQWNKFAAPGTLAGLIAMPVQTINQTINLSNQSATASTEM
jgi:hypothetical protein